MSLFRREKKSKYCSLNTKPNFYKCAICKLQLKPLKTGKTILDDNNCWLTTKLWAQNKMWNFPPVGGGGVQQRLISKKNNNMGLKCWSEGCLTLLLKETP